jgi:hypothetical protein
MAVLTDRFFTGVTISGSIKQLATATTGTSATKINFPALTVLSATAKFNTEVTTNAATGAVPAAPVAFGASGWQTVVFDSLGDGGVTRASTVPVQMSFTASAAITITATAILLIDGVEIGRGTVSAACTTTATSFTANVSVAAGTTFTSSSVFQCVVYGTGTNASVTTAVNVTLNYNATSRVQSGLTYTINASRTGSESSAQTDTASRTNATSRTASDSGGTGQTDSARSGGSTYNRTASQAMSNPADSTARQVTFARVTAETLSAMADTASRTQVDFRRATQNDTVPVDTALRVISITKTSPETGGTSQTDVASKTITYQRVTLYQFQPQDEPASAQTRAIRGYILNEDHTPFTGGATVMLIREDNVVVQTTTSDQYGAYVFPRNLLDTHTYTVAAFAYSGGSPVEAITERGLVPV